MLLANCFSLSSNDDSSAQNRPRELKVMSLEPSGNEDSEYALKVVLACLLPKRQRKTSGNTIFQSLVGGGGCGTNLPIEVVEMAKLCEFE
jgi:hypothetical protein